MIEMAQPKGFVIAKDGLGAKIRNGERASRQWVSLGSTAVATITFSLSSACSKSVRACRSNVSILCIITY